MNRKKALILLLIGLVPLTILLTVFFILKANSFNPLPVDVAVRDFFYNTRGEKYGFIFWYNRIITEMANYYFLIALVIVIAILTKLALPTLVIMLGCATGPVFSATVKLMCKRERPIEEFRWMYEFSSSFPSSHSSTAMCSYIILTYVVMRFSKNKYLKIVTPIISLFLVISIGISRLVLGMHYFTDIICGYSTGVIASLIVIAISEACIAKNFNFLSFLFNKKKED